MNKTVETTKETISTAHFSRLKEMVQTVKQIPTPFMKFRHAVMKKCGWRSDQTFYKKLNGQRRIKQIEMEAIEGVYDDMMDQNPLQAKLDI